MEICSLSWAIPVVSTILPPKSVAARYGHCLVMQTDAAWKLV